MSELKFSCVAKDCGRKFTTQDRLNAHIKNRHPELLPNSSTTSNSKINNPTETKPKIEISKNPMEKIMKPVTKIKNTLPEKHNILQPIEHKTSIHAHKNNVLLANKNNKNEIIKKKKDKKNIPIHTCIEDEVKIPNIIEERQNKLLNNLFTEINSLQNYMDKDIQFHKEFTVPEVPDYDKMYDDSDEEEKEKNGKNIEKKPKNKITVITKEMLVNDKNKDNAEDDDEFYKSLVEINLSKKNLYSFEDKKFISFGKLYELLILNISFNNISNVSDIQYLTNLKELYINNNQISDLAFCENLPNLIIFNAENNLINSITSLNSCIQLKTLKLAFNKIEYLNSTLRIFKNLKNLTELSIKENPFLSQLFAYREYFISNYNNILILDQENITEEKREIANNFYKENNPLYKSSKRPMSSNLRLRSGLNSASKKNELEMITEGDDNISDDEDIFISNNDNFNDNILAKTQVNFDFNKTNIYNKLNKGNIKQKENIIKEDKTKNEKIKLENIIKEQKKLIENLKKELDNSTKINKDYESKITKYKNELGDLEETENITTNSININNEDEEKNKIIQELEMWKNSYCKLLEQSMNTSPESKLMAEELFNDDNNINNIISQETNKKFERPQTATIKTNISADFQKVYKEINEAKKTENIFADVLAEETDEEEDEENDIKDKKEEKDDNNDLVEESPHEEIEEDDGIPDDEIEEMFRKSYQDIQKMRQDLKVMNETMDNKNINNKNNSNDNKSNDMKNNINDNKMTLKPVIVKKENNLNNNIFGMRGKQGNKLPSINKNITENNKINFPKKYDFQK